MRGRLFFVCDGWAKQRRHETVFFEAAILLQLPMRALATWVSAMRDIAPVSNGCANDRFGEPFYKRWFWGGLNGCPTVRQLSRLYLGMVL